MPLIPKFYHKDELLFLGIDENRLTRAGFIISHAFGEEWIEKHERDFEIYKAGKKKLIGRLLNRHPIFAGLVGVRVEESCLIVAIGEALETFSKEKSIKEMIERLKDGENVNPAIFELICATSLRYFGFKIEGLQVLNPDDNPVEIVTSKNGHLFWIECKSMKTIKHDEGFHQRLHAYLAQQCNDENYQLNIRGGMAFLVKLERQISTEQEYKRVIGLLKNNVNDIAHNCPDEQLPCIQIYEENTPMKIEFLSFLVNDDNFSEIEKYFHENARLYGGFGYTKQQVGAKLPDIDDIGKPGRRLHSLMGVSFPGDQSAEGKTITSFEKQLKKKISQQRSLIDIGANVILIFDSRSISSLDEAKEVTLRYSKYTNLTILIAEEEKTHFRYKFKSLISGANFTLD